MSPDQPAVTEGELPVAEAFGAFHPFIKGVFSQWHPTTFQVDGTTYVTAEQWMMAAKARLFADLEAEARILMTADPAEQKRLGQQVAAFDQAVWDLWKVSIVYRGNLEKFRQNEGAARQLRATGDAMLVEANLRDWIWGVGLAMDSPDLQAPSRWRGSNLLGRVLTKVRGDL